MNKKELIEKVKSLEEELKICKRGLQHYKKFNCKDEKTFAYLVNNYIIYKNMNEINNIHIKDEHIINSLQYKQLLKEKQEIYDKYNEWNTTLHSLGFNNVDELIIYINNNSNIKDTEDYISLNNKYEAVNTELTNLKTDFDNKIEDEKYIIDNSYNDEILSINKNHNEELSKIKDLHNKEIDKLKTEYDFKYFYDLYNDCKKDTKKDYDALTDASHYMLNARRTEITRANTDNWRNRIKKCYEIYELHKEDIKLVYISIDKMCKIRNIEKWTNWKLYLKNKIQEAKNITIKNKIKNNKLIVNNFNIKEYKKFILLSFILNNKNLIKNKISSKDNNKINPLSPEEKKKKESIKNFQ